MMIGINFQACIRDVVNDKVSEDEVTIIVAPTDLHQMGLEDSNMWDAYWKRNTASASQAWKGLDSEVVYNQVLFFYETGVLFSPANDFWRWSNGYFSATTADWYDLSPSEDKSTPAVREAWEHYKILSGLCK